MDKEYDRCEIAADLMPLYADEICSAVSRAFVEDHVKECEKCRAILQEMQSNAEESILSEEKTAALTLHRKHRDGRTLKSILIAIMVAYLPLVFIYPLFTNDTGLVPTNYPFKLLTVFLYTLPFFTSLISLGFTACKAISGDFKSTKNVPTVIVSAVTLLCCFDLDGALLYLALLCSAVNIIIWIVTAAKNKKSGRTLPLCKKTFLFTFFAVFTAFLAFTVTFTAISGTGGNRPEKDEYAESYADTVL